MSDTRPRDDRAHDDRAHDDRGPQLHAECYACPVGSFFNGVHGAGVGAQSEALDHLLNAAHELLEVARTAIDTADAAIEQQRDVRAQRGRSGSRDHDDADDTGVDDPFLRDDTPDVRATGTHSASRRVRRIEIV